MASFQMAKDTTPLSLSPNFILSENHRPHLSNVSALESIPTIDLNDQGSSNNCDGPSPLVQKISRALPEEMMTAMVQRFRRSHEFFFKLPPEERAKYFTTDHSKQVKLFNYYLKVEDEVFAEYAKEIGRLMKMLLGLLSQGLGLEKDCLQKKLGDNPTLIAQGNYYPPCPDPEVTLGLAIHTNLNALRVLRRTEGVTGLQVIKDGKWVAVDSLPNAFVINLGDQIQVLSNGRYKKVHDRAVTQQGHCDWCN
ncbi:flavonol synthase/flavanone 3-hydroxylase-like [Pyrus ussuriensis x Pyrus communis]|uniref:Flavonol synthase/flavanone 3-hydroxylase-like n=1 Tax=Pyrus ussuriensis x Pyrus communis TaxID=2448454 RepID=A0A5N5HFB8_9ROSA|nr:flavonol synthase/flavanone 3-hydroxylase-like [Pyrus ussuriensis x Pyrus communis]